MSNDIFSCKILGLTLSLTRQVSSANNLGVPVIALGRPFMHNRNSNAEL